MITKTKVAGLALLLIAGLAVTAWWVSAADKAGSLTRASGDTVAGFVDGIHYRTLESPLAADVQPLETAVSVHEFFWYGCPHCQAFEPQVRQWLKTTGNVDFQQIPVVWNELTSLHAAMFYVATDAVNAEQLQDKLFEQIIDLRQERNIASQIEQLAGVFAEHGIDRTALTDKLISPSIQAKVNAGAQMMKQAQVASTPTILVDGKWVVLNNEAVGQAGVFKVVDFLVQQALDAR